MIIGRSFSTYLFYIWLLFACAVALRYFAVVSFRLLSKPVQHDLERWSLATVAVSSSKTQIFVWLNLLCLTPLRQKYPHDSLWYNNYLNSWFYADAQVLYTPRLRWCLSMAISISCTIPRNSKEVRQVLYIDIEHDARQVMTATAALWAVCLLYIDHPYATEG